MYYFCCMRNAKVIDALIKLIDDPDELIFAQVRAEILTGGYDALELLLEKIDYEQIQPDYYNRVKKLIIELQVTCVHEQLEKWCLSSEKDLLKGLYIITKFQFPELTLGRLEELIQPLERKIWLEVNRRMTAFEIVERINQMWFENIGLHVEPKKTATPFNTFINTVLEDLQGTPLSIGLLYSIVSQRVNLPIYGVNFPGQFVLAYIDEWRIHKLVKPLGSGGVLFYLLPSDACKVIIKKRLDEALEHKKQKPVREYFEPSSHSSLIILYLDELMATYKRYQRQDLVAVYQKFKERILELA